MKIAVCIVGFLSVAQAQEWIDLFDGKTPKGWVEVTGKPFPTKSWKIEDGCLRTLPPDGGMQDIRTVGTYRNFEFTFSWKLKKDGNSGVKYLIQNYDEWTNKDGRQARARGLEYQLVDPNSSDAKDPTRFTAALYSILAAPGAKFDMATFNESRIVVNGNRVEHWLNGVRVLAFDLTDAPVRAAMRNLLPKGSSAATPLKRESAISLQDHDSEVWFQNLRIRRLPD